jgi:hypothetical protein
LVDGVESVISMLGHTHPRSPRVWREEKREREMLMVER